VGSQLNRARQQLRNISFGLAGNPRMNCSTAQILVSVPRPGSGGSGRGARHWPVRGVRERLWTSAKYRNGRSFATRALRRICGPS
jgi:hypothetical protein